MKKVLKTLAEILLFVIYFAWLEVAKNQIWGWIASILLIVAYFICLKKALDKKGKSVKGLSVLSLVLLLAAVCILSGPKPRQIKAIEDKNSELTQQVKVKEGLLVGVKDSSKRVEVFAGIPYAKPPIGELRWKEPQDPDSWDGVRVCDTFAPMAMQKQSNPIMAFGTRVVGYNEVPISLNDNFKEAMSEDCLYLNIWRPEGVKEGDKLPVLFYIHGGSLNSGQSYYDAYNGASLASQGIIVVNIAYRVGVFGYMADTELMEESENGTTGNYGLLDQIKALKWVNENIEAFGGDPTLITIAGESAGSSSVNALCVSPLSKGLFKRAVAESSGITPKVPYHTFRTLKMALDVGADIKKEFGCNSIDELRKVPAEKLLKTKGRNNEMTVDGYAITKQPYLTYEEGDNNEEALLSGFNADEARAFIMFDKKATVETYEEFLEKFAGSFAHELALLRPVNSDKEADASFDELIGVAWFAYSHYTWSEYLKAQDKPCYLYFFTKENKALGPWHAGELPYLYGNIPDGNNYTEADRELSKEMQRYYVNFVKTGDPNGDGLTKWVSYNEDSEKYLVFSDEVEMKEDKYIDIFKLYDKVMDERLLHIDDEEE